MENGMVHLYWGDGKGKTTAAMGLALRALGHGQRVVILQFLKGSPSGEVPLLEKLGAVVIRSRPGQKFVFQMSEAEKAAARQEQTENLCAAMAAPADLLLLDEACAAWQLDMVDRALLQKAVLEKPPRQELVLTGRTPADWMLARADYSTEMCCRRHPYDKGTSAREGVEF
ncbi:MAG: cob(I)yrinic acid a,c-diamide adenosyltransferase [Faecalibacterium sp.]|nr:cob(I)yrinic acid a,c-diamide adenosyltransferase [Faecalibacterium sp.]